MASTNPGLPLGGYPVEQAYGPPDEDGFRLFRARNVQGFNGQYPPIACRADPDGRTRARVETGPEQANVRGAIHGGFILALSDQLLFAGPALAGWLTLGLTVTLSCNVTFIGAGTCGEPIEAIVEKTGETGRLLFLRGLIQQKGRTIASIEGTLRKLKPATA